MQRHCSARMVSFRVIAIRLHDLVEAGVDVGKLPGSLTISELVRFPIEQLRHLSKLDEPQNVT